MLKPSDPLGMGDVRRTSTFRLTAMLGVVFLVAIFTLLGLIYTLTERQLVARTDRVLALESHTYAEVPADQLLARLRQALGTNTSGLNYLVLTDAQGKVVAGNLAPPRVLRLGEPFDMPASAAQPVPLRLLAVRTSNGNQLIVGRDITQIEDLRARVVSILVGSGLVASICVAMAAALLSMGPLRRIRHLTAIARRIAAGELSLRMPVSARRDELDLVAETINTMIGEIERLLAQVKGATDAIAHDLRAPLGHIRNRLEAIQRQTLVDYRLASLEGVAADALVPSSAAAPNPALSNVLAGALDELDLVLARFNAILRISELEATNRRAGFAPLDPMKLVIAVCELFEPLAEERGVRLDMAGSCGQVVEGDERLLFEAISNLVENAIKFVPREGVVTVAVRPPAGGADTPDRVDIEVRDNGPGIPADERLAVLGRFHRGSGASHVPGSGLGLSLVAAITHLHGFDLELLDGDPGLIVRISAVPVGAVNGRYPDLP